MVCILCVDSFTCRRDSLLFGRQLWISAIPWEIKKVELWSWKTWSPWNLDRIQHVWIRRIYGTSGVPCVRTNNRRIQRHHKVYWKNTTDWGEIWSLQNQSPTGTVIILKLSFCSFWIYLNMTSRLDLFAPINWVRYSMHSCRNIADAVLKIHTGCLHDVGHGCWNALLCLPSWIKWGRGAWGLNEISKLMVEFWFLLICV